MDPAIADGSIANSTIDRMITDQTVVEDRPTLRSILLGSGIGVAAASGCVVNMLVARALIGHGFLNGPNASFYKLSLNLVLSDTMHIICHALYLASASASRSPLLPGGWWRLPSAVSIFAWKAILFTLAVMAVNRYVAVCRPNLYSHLFSPKRTNLIVALIWSATMIVGVVGEFLLPCCSTYLNYKTYSFGQSITTANSYNYTNNLINLPLNVLASLFVIVFYSAVVWKIRTNNRKIEESIAQQSAMKRRRKEAWYAVQLIIINVVFISFWLTFQVLNRFLPAAQADRGIFSIVIYMGTLHASSDSIVLLTLNREVRAAVCRCAATVDSPSGTGAAAANGFTSAAAQHSSNTRVTTTATSGHMEKQLTDI